ncbi:MAG: MopE-related protein [Myxococcota bacterium]
MLTPSDGQVVNVGQAVGFSVLVTDDQPVSALMVAIFSSLDGTLYSGAPATGGVVAFSKVLSPGTHLLTFTVEDADGLSDVLTQQLRLNQSPNVELLAPKEGDNFSRTSPVKVQAKVTDPDDATSTLQALILSSADGIVAEPTIDSAGYIRAELTELSGGEHLLEVQVTDPHQAQDSSQVTITINPCSGEDLDQDGYSADPACSVKDCNDEDDSIYPGASEVCNGIDEDCDGKADEGVTSTWYKDNDGDGYGATSSGTTQACTPPSGYSATSTDCNDTVSSINPSAAEICNGKDDNCDGKSDDGQGITYYRDADGDGYGSASSSVQACSQPSGYSSVNTDCDDVRTDVNPGAVEVCNSRDDNCDGIVDNLPGAGTFYRDLDNDGYGMSSSGVISACSKPSGYSAFGSDCDDANNAKYPGATDTCGDGVDANCDGRDACTVTSNTSVSTGAVATIRGGSANENLGYAPAFVGDVDGDGFDDMLVSAHYNDAGGTDAGAAYLFLGPVTGSSLTASNADAVLLGEQPGDYAGFSVSGAGDVNGDGYGDFVLGAPLQDEAGADAGAVYLVLGPVSGSIQVANVKARFLGEKVGDQAGSSVAALGDMNKDGYADFAIGAEKYDDGSKKDTGAVYVIFGSPSLSGVISLSAANARWVGELNYDYAGGSVSGPGDVNGDGTPDMLIGARENDGSAIDAGAAYLVYGPVTGVKNLSTANVKFRGITTLDYAGWSVAGLGDTNGDGKADFAIGVPGADPTSRTDAGKVYVVLGAASYSSPVSLSSASIIFAGDGAGDAFGRSISGGDINGDGAGDLVVGAPGLDVPGQTEAGGLYILLASRTGFSTGEKKGLDAAWNRFVGMNGDGGGPAVVVVGDMTGDFAAEVAVGFPGYDTSTTTQHGAVMVVPWRYLGP